MSDRKRYGIVGMGHRATIFVEALVCWHKEDALLVGLCDPSQVRMDWHNERIEKEFSGESVATFREFGQMLSEAKPDAVIVCSPDHTHHEYVCRALEAGVEVFCEKPMTIDLLSTRDVLDSVKRTGKALRVLLNLRFAHLNRQIKEVVASGAIGKPKSVLYTELLDTWHGADYFRRWHRDKSKSGGLLLQKSTHHFDQVNWWIDSKPETVFAFGDLLFYGKENARLRGIEQSYDRYTGNAETLKDPFALHLDNSHELYKGLYLNAEEEDGYVRDRNVFGEGITIEDTLSVVVRYKNGTHLNYSLVAYSPYEGFRATVTGTEGHLEVEETYSPHIVQWNEEKRESKTRRAEKTDVLLRVYPMFSEPYEVDVPSGEDGHGGGDKGISKAMFAGNPTEEDLATQATHIDGAAASLMGIAANLSIETGQPVDCDGLLRLDDYRMD